MKLDNGKCSECGHPYKEEMCERIREGDRRIRAYLIKQGLLKPKLVIEIEKSGGYT